MVDPLVMATHTSTRTSIVGSLAAVAVVIGLSALTGPAAVAGTTDRPVLERSPVTAAATVEVAAPPATTAPVEPAEEQLPVTTTVPPAPSTTLPPPPAAPTTTAAPAPATTAPPAPTPVAAPPPQAATAESPEDRVRRVYSSAVPQTWQADFEVRFEIIDGSTSWAYGDGRILVARSHADGGEAHLADVLAHEFGHLIAFRYGTKAYVGAAPEGWPEPPQSPAEAWADCVQTAFTGRVNPSHGLPPCGTAQLDWATAWLAQGPPRSE